jgi:hypothetical protein
VLLGRPTGIAPAGASICSGLAHAGRVPALRLQPGLARCAPRCTAWFPSRFVPIVEP